MIVAPSAPLAVTRVRAPLSRTAGALARGACTIGFLGGSITAADTGTRWPGPFMQWMVARWPGVRFTIANAAIGATGSDLAAFHAPRDIIAHGCDLVFVEYSVNDHDQPTARRSASREGVLRQLRRAGCDIVLVHAFRAEMRPDFDQGALPASIAEFEVLADHYHLNSVNAALHALREVARGALTHAEWLPDGLHPERRGSQCYADAVSALLVEALAQPASGAPAPSLPPPLCVACWEHTHLVPFERVTCQGPWTIHCPTTSPWIDRLLHCTEPHATLRFEFAGRGLLIAFDFGHASGEVRLRIDGGTWHETARERFPWHGPAGWLRPTLVADDLTPGPHECELETLPARSGTPPPATTSIAFLGVVA